MILKYGIEIDDAAIAKNIDRISNQIFKLLPTREEGGEWLAPLQNLIFEIAGMNELFLDQIDLFSLLCNLEALKTLKAEDDFMRYRNIIFNCLSIMTKVKECLVLT